MSHHPAGDTSAGTGYEAAWLPTANDLLLSGKSAPYGDDERFLEEKQIQSTLRERTLSYADSSTDGHIIKFSFLPPGKTLHSHIPVGGHFLVSGPRTPTFLHVETAAVSPA